MQGLRLVRKIVYARVKVQRCESQNIVSCRGKIVYPRIDAGTKCCLQRFKAVSKIADARDQGFSRQGECTLGMQIQNYKP